MASIVPLWRSSTQSPPRPVRLSEAATSAPVLRALHEGTVKALKSREVSARLSNEAAEIVAGTPQEFAAFLKAESEKWTAVIRKAKVRIAE